MAAASFFFRAICFILVQSISSALARSELINPRTNTTGHSSLLEPIFHSEQTDRLKRSPGKKSLRELHIQLKYETGEIVDLHLMLVAQYLANRRLPVVLPFGYQHRNVMDEIGEFMMYQDIRRCTAMVYFVKEQALYGVVGVDYFIENLPFAFDEHGMYQLGVVEQPHMQKIPQQFPHIFPGDVIAPPSDMEAVEEFLRPTENVHDQSTGCLPLYLGPSTSQQRFRRNSNHQNYEEQLNENGHGNNTVRIRRENRKFQRYYLEVLVFISKDIIELFEGGYNEMYPIWIVKHHIVYFNSVDMMFQRMRAKIGEIRMNIAKIVFEDVLEPFDFVVGDSHVEYTDLITKLPQYLNRYRDNYQEDSFDHVFIHTWRTIVDNGVLVNGMTRHGLDLYEGRKINRFYNVVPMTVVTFKPYYADYAVAVHEIGRRFNMKLDSKNKGLTAVGQCFSIMQRGGPKCDRCLHWSDDSRRSYDQFMTEDRNRCFLLNEPRSLRPAGVHRFVWANAQCRCYGYDSCEMNPSGHLRKFIRTDKCGEPMVCLADETSKLRTGPTVKPFDGTPCASHKVCWNGKCEIMTHELLAPRHSRS